MMQNFDKKLITRCYFLYLLRLTYFNYQTGMISANFNDILTYDPEPFAKLRECVL